MIYTKDQLEKIHNEGIEGFETITENGVFQYELTLGDLEWLDWIGDRYAIAELISDNIDRETAVVTLDVLDVSEALSDDGVDRCPCLSEDSYLNKLVWFIGPVEY